MTLIGKHQKPFIFRSSIQYWNMQICRYSTGICRWDNCTQQEKQELEKIQIEAARISSGATKLVSLQKLYDEIGWETLETRRRKHKLVLFYKMFYKLSPLYLSSLVPQLVQNASRYSLRNANNVQTIVSHTNQYFHSFLPSAIRDWNTLSEDMLTLQNLSRDV